MSLCYLAQFASDSKCEWRSDGLPDRAHLIPVQRLKQAGLSEHVWDRPTYVMACRKHHHAFDNGFLKLREEHHPGQFRSWAKEHNFFYTPDRGWLHGIQPQAAA